MANRKAAELNAGAKHSGTLYIQSNGISGRKDFQTVRELLIGGKNMGSVSLQVRKARAFFKKPFWKNVFLEF